MRQGLQQVSKEREHNWPNTIEALRLKKEQDKINAAARGRHKENDKEDQALKMDEEHRLRSEGRHAGAVQRERDAIAQQWASYDRRVVIEERHKN
eukprot:gene35058-25750_t